MDASNRKIIKDTVMKTLFNMFGNDDSDYCALKKACIPFHKFFNVKDTEYINQFILYPVSEDAEYAFLTLADAPSATDPYIFIDKIGDKWYANKIYFNWIHRGETHSKNFDMICANDINEFMEKMYEFINKRN
ncbi:MAG: hypothetical protein [Wendovervirus sonii]|uniref:Uncharacterized protein n=1 Tax=phage Lak_Megaphage_Sonny TaxID=3109229 RepID=A0ABZ0Z5D4_9CAUD|nr:MAG: hypothetical protein [phage Lak_Megaphage_Sonny]